MRIALFALHGKHTAGLWRREDLENMPCGACDGKLKIVEREISEYAEREGLLLRCVMCGGEYRAIEEGYTFMDDKCE